MIDYLITCTTTGFGGIAPQTTLAKVVVTLEIIAAFIMIAIAMNLLAFKKDTSCTDGELDEITKW